MDMVGLSERETLMIVKDSVWGGVVSQIFVLYRYHLAQVTGWVIVLIKGTLFNMMSLKSSFPFLRASSDSQIDSGMSSIKCTRTQKS